MNLSYRSSSSDKLNSLNMQKFGKTDKMINVSKREKLKQLLLEKFMKKYDLKNPIPIIVSEISDFLQHEKVNDSDLKKLDEKLNQIIQDIKTKEVLRDGLLTNEPFNQESYSKETSKIKYISNNNNNYKCSNKNKNDDNLSQNNPKTDFILPELNDALSVRSKASKMSGASHLSKFNENNAKAKADQKEELDFLKAKSPKQERINFENEGDEWNAIVKYNNSLYHQEKIENKLKDLEIKKRIKEDLDNQIREKLKQKHDENLKNKEFDKVLLDHCDYLKDMEIQREKERKDKIMREKENRDQQVKDEKRRKKIEIIKEKKYDRETVKNIKMELQKEKELKIKKREQAVEMLHQTLRENELNRLKTMEYLHKEKLDDVNAIDEYNKVLERQEQERAEYFRKIERNSKNYVNKMAESILVDLDKKGIEEDEKMKFYLEDKERR